MSRQLRPKELSAKGPTAKEAFWRTFYPDLWADPKSRSTFWFHNLHHRNIRAQHWGIYFLDPVRGLGKQGTSYQRFQIRS